MGWWWLSWWLTVAVSERCRVEFLLRRSSWDDSRDFQFTTWRQNRQNCHVIRFWTGTASVTSIMIPVPPRDSWTRAASVWPVSPVEVDGSVTRLVVAAMVVVVVGGELVTGAVENKPDETGSVSVLKPSKDTSYCTERDNIVRTCWIMKYLIMELTNNFLSVNQQIKVHAHEHYRLLWLFLLFTHVLNKLCVRAGRQNPHSVQIFHI